MKIDRVGEFELIRRIAERSRKTAPPGAFGVGDDCAVLPWRGAYRQLLSTDLLVENVHFLRHRISPEQLGAKALAVNLSDIAAMGGTPRNALLSLGLPGSLDSAWVDAFFNGFLDLASRTGVALLGGDTTASPGGIIVNVAITGTAAANRIKYRHSAHAGDVLFVTDTLGDSAAGLRLLPNEPGMHDEVENRLIRRHLQPRPHLDEGRWLASHAEVHAMMDVSDGIDADARRIMEASGCGADIDLADLPCSADLIAVADRYGWRMEELAACGGEDYCLLLSVDAAAVAGLQGDYSKRFGRPLYRIGVLTGRSGAFRYTGNGGECQLASHGFDHFFGTNAGVDEDGLL